MQKEEIENIYGVEFYESDEIKFVAPDSRTDVGEYWTSMEELRDWL